MKSISFPSDTYETCYKPLLYAQLGWPGKSLQWRYNECNGVSNHQHLSCSLNHLFRRRSKKTSKLRVTCLCGGNSLVTDEFPTQRASNVENVSMWWCHHVVHGQDSLTKNLTCSSMASLSRHRLALQQLGYKVLCSFECWEFKDKNLKAF